MRIKILKQSSEVRYKSLYIPFEKLKTVVNQIVPSSFLEGYVLIKKFNSLTGEIEYKYAWDSLIHSLHDSGYLKIMLDSILQDEQESED